MNKPIFTGSGVAIVTPMFPDGSVNYDMLGQLIDFNLNNSTDAIIACGTTGESSTLSDEEHVKVIEYAVKKVNGRVPVIAGTGSNDTKYTVWLSQEAESAGADALLIVTPYYNKTSQAGLIKHYHYVADRVNKPIIVYNVPSRTGLDVKPETYLELSKHPNIAASKEANGNIAALAQTMALCGDQLDVYSGNDDQITSFMSLGAKGVISVLANVCPRQTHDICTHALSGNFVASSKLQFEMISLCNALFIDVNPIPVKAALNLMGYNVGECRMPLTIMSETNMAKLRKAMSAAGLI